MIPLRTMTMAGGSDFIGFTQIYRILGVLLLVCALAVFLLRFLYGKSAGKGRFGLGWLKMGKRWIRVVDRCPLSSQQSLLLVELGGTCYLLGVTSHNISLLTSVDSQALPQEVGAVAGGNKPTSISGLKNGNGL